MRITTDSKAAVADPGNRAEAARIINAEDPKLWAEADEETREQWIDDLIFDWVDQLDHDLETGAYDDWQPDPIYQAGYAHACGYYD